MGWFEEQIKQRKESDAADYSASFMEIAGAILGKKISAAYESDSDRTKTAIHTVLNFYHIKAEPLPNTITDINEQIEYLMHPKGVMRRKITLRRGWYKESTGAIIGIRKSDKTAVAFIPRGFSGYSYFDCDKGSFVKITSRNQNLFETEAIVFYKPFPQTQLSLKSLGLFMFRCLSIADYAMVGFIMLLSTFLGLIQPKLTYTLMGIVVLSKDMSVLFSLMTFIISATISTSLINTANELVTVRIRTKLDQPIKSATMARILSLPANFFAKHNSRELSNIIQQMQRLYSLLSTSIFSPALSAIFSLAYISQIFRFAPVLVIPSLCILLATVIFSMLVTFKRMKILKTIISDDIKESSMSYSIISGIQKIKLAGAEKRFFVRWANLYSKKSRQYNPPTILKYNTPISLLISSVGTVIMYYLSTVNNIPVAEYYAFNTAYGMVSASFMSFVSIAVGISNIKPVYDVVKPILNTKPEISEGKQIVTNLAGEIELNNVFFRYNESLPYVIENLSLKIKAGQYVAIVGSTGCGKSTLVRLLLGFENPNKGTIYYDKKNIETLDLKSLRRHIGNVMQNGKLFVGDIFSNITISAPWLTLDDAWEAAKIAEIADDIENLPMKMHTMISEGSGGISGGQKQRLMIARAVAGKPRILIFDEATSALDNITQKKVSKALDELNCTRIVIAHRLSTIKQCDRIIYLENGNIGEEGTYDELIAKNGKFAELVKRQRIDMQHDTTSNQQ